jgi:hypothetical protein
MVGPNSLTPMVKPTTNNMNTATIKEYISEWVSGSHDDSFYKKWALFIELVTGVRIDESFTDLQKYAVANTCYMNIQYMNK